MANNGRFEIEFDKNTKEPIRLVWYNENNEKSDYSWTFIDKKTLKDMNPNLYAWIEIPKNKEEAPLWLKHGEAPKQSIYDRLKDTGVDHEKYVIRIWTSKNNNKLGQDDISNKELESRYKNNIGFEPLSFEKINTDEAYAVYTPDGLNNLLNIISDVHKTTPITKRNDIGFYKDVENFVYNEIDLDNYHNFNLDLDTRWGKTKTNLLLMKERLSKEKNCRIHMIPSYVGTVRSSYKDEIDTYSYWNNICFIDPDTFETTEEIVDIINNWLEADKENIIVYYLPLTGGNSAEKEDESVFYKRSNPLLSFSAYRKSMFTEETDIGAHCEKQADKIKKLCKSANVKYFFSTTGTNADRATKIFNNLKYYNKDYVIDILGNSDSGRKNVVKIHWNVLNNSEYLKLGYIEKDDFENFSDMFTVVDEHLKGESYLKVLIRCLIDPHSMPQPLEKEARNNWKSYLYNWNNKKVVDYTAAFRFFCPKNKEAQILFGKLIEEEFGTDKVVVRVLNGEETTNKECQHIAETAIKDAGNRKVIFISSDMGARSWSIPQVKNIVLLVDNPSFGTLKQYIGRGFTPWNEEHTTCYIVDFRMKSTIYDSCASTYVSGLACKKLDTDDGNTLAKSIPAFFGNPNDRRIVFTELFDADNPIKELTESEIKEMMCSSDYRTKLACYHREVIVSDRMPEATICNINEKPPKTSRLNKNIRGKGDLNRKGGKGKNLSKTKKEAIEENKKMQHAYWIINKGPGALNTNSFDSNIWEQELKVIESDPEAIRLFEENNGVTFNLIKSLIKYFLTEDIIDDTMF